MSDSASYYIHRELGESVIAIGGSYRLTKEVRLPIDEPPGAEVLYVVGHGLLDSTCCGFGGFSYAQVHGFVRRWKALETRDGLPMTEVEPISDSALRKRLSQLIKKRESVIQVNFR